MLLKLTCFPHLLKRLMFHDINVKVLNSFSQFCYLDIHLKTSTFCITEQSFIHHQSDPA